MRLTKEIREAIVDKAMRQAFDARDKACDKATTALADMVYAHEYGAAEKIANKLPQGWCETSSHIYIEAAGFQWYYRSGSGKDNKLPMSKQRRIPINPHCNAVKIGGAHPLNDQAQAVAEEYQAINRDKGALKAKLRALVFSVATTERLLEAWPECKKFIPADIAPTRALVPVELVPELNAALGIQTKARKAGSPA